jgi:hypothetical protein
MTNFGISLGLSVRHCLTLYVIILWRCSGTNPKLGKEAIEKLLHQLDTYVPVPKRDKEKPFMMPVEGTDVLALPPALL